MIEIEFHWAIAIFLSIAIALVLGLWIFYNYDTDEKSLSGQTEHLNRCPYCGHMFFNYKNLDILVCPLCKSYLDSETVNKN